jgi:hypothetical protein
MSYEGGYTSAVNSASNRQSQDTQRQAALQQLAQVAQLFQQQQEQQKRKAAAQQALPGLMAQLAPPPAAAGPQPPMPGAPSVAMAPPGAQGQPPMGQLPPPPGVGFASPGGAAAPGPQKPMNGPAGPAPGPGGPPMPAPGWKSLPAPPDAAPPPPGSIPPPPEDGAVVPKQLLSVTDLAKALEAKGIKGQEAFDLMEAWKPFMDSENKQQLAHMKLENQAQAAALNAYAHVLQANAAQQRAATGDRRVTQNQPLVDARIAKLNSQVQKLGKSLGADMTGNQGTSEKYEKDEKYRKNVDFWANVVKDGGQLPPRFAQGGVGKAMFSDIISVVPTLGTGDHREMRAGAVELAGDKSKARALGTRSANIEQAASEARKMSKIVLDTSSKFPRTEFQPVNKAIAAFEKQTGGTEVRQFGAAINSYINAYARAVNPTGVATVSDKEHARDMLSTADTPDQVKAIIAVLDREMTAAQESPREVRADQRKEITGDRGPGAVREFKTEAEAKAAGLEPGTRVKIGGVSGTWQ